MVVRGRVQNGVVVLPDDVALPEGTEVFVVCPVASGSRGGERRQPTIDGPPKRVHLPLVPSKRPGMCRLTADRVAELLDEDDLSP